MRPSFLAVFIPCVFLCAMPSGSPAAPVAPLPLPNTVLIIDAKPDQLAAFDRALRPLIPARYDLYGLGCTVDYLDGQGDEGCNVMRRGNPVPDDLEYLVYYFNGGNKLLRQKFETARSRVLHQFPDAKLLLTFRDHQERQPDCSVQPQPCVSVPYCQQYGNCSTQTSSCKKC
jgi:hypothetical protein